MNKMNFELLSGRIEGLAEALLRVTAALEMQGVIDGPQMSEAWRAAVRPHTVDTEVRRIACTTLQELALALDAARHSRQAFAQSHQSQTDRV